MALANITSGLESIMLPSEVSTFFQDWKAKKRSFRIMAIGDCGSGKTALVNNLLGEEIAQEQVPSILSTFHGAFQGAPVTVHETSGLENPDAEGSTEFNKDMSSLLRGGKIDVVIFCLKMTETRMRDSLINSLQRYTNMGLDWRKTVIALTFADVKSIPKNVRQERSYDPVRYFNERVAEWKQTLAQTLTNRIGVPIGLARELKVAPTAGDPAEELLNHEKWFGQMWSNVLDAIKAAPSSPSQESIEQPRTETSLPGYQLSQNQTPPTCNEGLGSCDVVEAAPSISCMKVAPQSTSTNVAQHLNANFEPAQIFPASSTGGETVPRNTDSKPIQTPPSVGAAKNKCNLCKCLATSGWSTCCCNCPLSCLGMQCCAFKRC